jgi:hypothetical protein
MLSRSELWTAKEAVFTADRDGGSADGELAGQQIILSVQGRHGTDDLNRGPGVQGFFHFLAQERSDMSIDQALGTSHEQMHADWGADHVPGDHLLDVTVESDFVRPIVGNTKALCNTGFGRRLGDEWNSQDRKQEASQRPRDR